MGNWLYTSGTWKTFGAAARTPLVGPGYVSGANGLKLQIPDVTHGVRGMPLCSGDGHSGYEAGFFGANVEIRKATFGVTAGAAVANGASDTPASASCSVAHGLAAGVPCELEPRWVGGKLEVWINGAMVLRHTPAASEPYTQLRHYGIVADVVPARVNSFELCTLIAEYSQDGEALIAVCDNNVSASLDGRSIQSVAASVFSHGGPVSLAAMNQMVYAVGGGQAVVVDPSVPSVAVAAATFGELPGATPGLAGSTTATILCRFLSRMAWANGRNLHLSAVDDPLDHDTGDPNAGHAVVLVLPQTITALCEIANGVLVIGMRDQVWRLVGDPEFDAAAYLRPVEKAQGIAGKDAIFPIDDGKALALGIGGLFIVGQSGNASDLSSADLDEGLSASSRSSYTVQILPDYPRGHIHIVNVPEGADSDFGPLLPFRDTIYVPQIGGYRSGRGGYYPRIMPYRVGPAASWLYQGIPIFATRDGWLLSFDDSVATDDGTPIDSRLCCALIDQPDMANDTLLEEMGVILGTGSADATLKVYSGRTPQEAFVGTGDTARNTEFQATIPASESGWPILHGARGRALVAELSASGVRILVERVEVRTTVEQMTTGPRVTAPSAPPAPCGPPVVASGGGGFGGGGGLAATVYPQIGGDNISFGDLSSLSEELLEYVALPTALGGGGGGGGETPSGGGAVDAEGAGSVGSGSIAID